MSSASRTNPPANLRLFTPDENSAEQFWPGMTLSQFFYRWFIPIMLEGENADPDTIGLHKNAVNYWIAITLDPPLTAIDEFKIAEFKKLLPAATYQRGPLAPARKLADATIKKHLRSIRAILYCVGPATDPKRRVTKSILPAVPHIQVGKARTYRKASFDLPTALRIIEATYHLPQTRRRRKLSLVRLGQLLRALIFGWYYIGERSSSIVNLDWRWIEYRHDGPWVKIPPEGVDKTEKPLEKPLHADAIAAFEELRTAGHRVIAWPHTYSHLSDLHDLLQKMAGIPESLWLSPQAWRRMHGKQLALLGADVGMEMARRGLNHSDAKITEDYYASIEAELIRKLPSIRIDPNSVRVDADGQKRLF